MPLSSEELTQITQLLTEALGAEDLARQMEFHDDFLSQAYQLMEFLVSENGVQLGIEKWRRVMGEDVVSHPELLEKIVAENGATIALGMLSSWSE